MKRLNDDNLASQPPGLAATVPNPSGKTVYADPVGRAMAFADLLDILREFSTLEFIRFDITTD